MKINFKRIREIRMQKGYSQEYMAHILNISQSKYSRLENGSINFNVPTLSKLIITLEVNPFEIVSLSSELKKLMQKHKD